MGCLITKRQNFVRMGAGLRYWERVKTVDIVASRKTIFLVFIWGKVNQKTVCATGSLISEEDVLILIISSHL